MKVLSDPEKNENELVLTLFSGVIHNNNNNNGYPPVKNDDSCIQILATSAKTQQQQKVERLLIEEDRPLLSDRQQPLDHLKPKTLVVSTIRVVMKQAAEVLAHFLSDKLEQETEMDDLISKGQMTIKEADEKTQEWEDREWNLLIQSFPHKAWTALWKFHATTLLCRLYEGIVDKLFFHNDEILDKLTLDVFKSSKRTSKACGHENKVSVLKQMFVTCLWANAILYLADFSVSEMIITVGWYRLKRRGRREQALLKASEAKEEDNDKPATTSSLAKQSANLVVSRTVGWVAASAGGAVGTIVYPGWGTLMGVNMGDSMVASVLEE